MQAIIMAAGKGSRLGDMTKDIPKSFLEVNGFKLIEYNIALLHRFGIRDILLVTGYQNDKMEAFAEKIEGVRCVCNPFYEMVNVLGSFYIAQEHLEEKDTVYMHADTLCAPEIMEDMLQEKGDIVLPVDFRECDEEAMKVRTNAGAVVEISKSIACDMAEGEFIGIAKISGNVMCALKEASQKLMLQKKFQSYFEGAIEELISQNRYEIRAISTKGKFWGEIDFLEDYNRVMNEIPQNLVEIAEKESIR